MSISVYRIKPPFVTLLRPFARGLATVGVIATLMTATACPLSLLYAAASRFAFFKGETL